MSEVREHAIVRVVTADERELREHLAALEAEVKAETRVAVVEKSGARAPATARPAAKRSPPAAEVDAEDTGLEMLAHGARLAGTAKKELTRPREKGDKSWLASGVLSMLFGPVGWLYAGSFREAIPAGLLYVLLASVAMKLPLFLLWPVMMIALPLSGIAGVVYAIQHNRYGQRMRLFDKDEEHEAEKKRLESGD